MIMLQFACLFLISRAGSLNYKKIAGNVGNALDECLGIVDSVNKYVGEVESLEEHRRRTQNDEGDVSVNLKLKACVSILDAVDNYRDYHSGLLLFHKFMQWQEVDSLNELLKPVSRKLGVVLYVASRDGDKGSDFHSACDNKGATVVIVETTKGIVFGGYTDSNLWSKSGYSRSSTSFLFQIRPNVRKYAIKSVEHAVYDLNRYGPTFGGGHDMHISSGALSNKNSYVNGHSYACKGKNLNGGQMYFQVKQYFVLKAIRI